MTESVGRLTTVIVSRFLGCACRAAYAAEGCEFDANCGGTWRRRTFRRRWSELRRRFRQDASGTSPRSWWWYRHLAIGTENLHLTSKTVFSVARSKNNVTKKLVKWLIYLWCHGGPVIFHSNKKLTNFDKNRKHKAINNSVNVARLLNLQCVSAGVTSIYILIVTNNMGSKEIRQRA